MVSTIEDGTFRPKTKVLPGFVLEGPVVQGYLIEKVQAGANRRRVLVEIELDGRARWVAGYHHEAQVWILGVISISETHLLEVRPREVHRL